MYGGPVFACPRYLYRFLASDVGSSDRSLTISKTTVTCICSQYTRIESSDGELASGGAEGKSLSYKSQHIAIPSNSSSVFCLQQSLTVSLIGLPFASPCA